MLCACIKFPVKGETAENVDTLFCSKFQAFCASLCPRFILFVQDYFKVPQCVCDGVLLLTLSSVILTQRTLL